MASDTQMTISIKDDEGNENDGILYYTVYSAGERAKRSITALVGCWIVAGLSIPIPVAHLALVPGFFIAGPVLAYFRLKMVESKEKVVGVCPRHKEEVTIPLENTDTLPKYTYCPECDGSIQLVEKEPVST